MLLRKTPQTDNPIRNSEVILARRNEACADFVGTHLVDLSKKAVGE